MPRGAKRSSNASAANNDVVRPRHDPESLTIDETAGTTTAATKVSATTAAAHEQHIGIGVFRKRNGSRCRHIRKRHDIAVAIRSHLASRDLDLSGTFMEISLVANDHDSTTTPTASSHRTRITAAAAATAAEAIRSRFAGIGDSK